jgi:hypothetical protein
MFDDKSRNFFVERASEHHHDDLHHFFVSVAHAIDETRLDAKFLRKVGNILAAAMHDNDVNANFAQQRNILRKGLLERVVGHNRAAVFNHEGFVFVGGDVWQCLN